MVVRLVLSHVMQPTGEPAETAATVAWIAAVRVLSRRPPWRLSPHQTIGGPGGPQCSPWAGVRLPHGERLTRAG